MKQQLEIQNFILDQFNSKDVFEYNEIVSITTLKFGCSEKVVRKVIILFVNSKILNLENNKIFLTDKGKVILKENEIKTLHEFVNQLKLKINYLNDELKQQQNNKPIIVDNQQEEIDKEKLDQEFIELENENEHNVDVITFIEKEFQNDIIIESEKHLKVIHELNELVKQQTEMINELQSRVPNYMRVHAPNRI